MENRTVGIEFRILATFLLSLLFLLFRLLPVISIFEIRTLLPQQRQPEVG